MTSQTTQKCIVCGTETRSRCSSCSQSGLHVPFCSLNHQNLVWPAHNLVCGPGKANPFLWPRLTSREAEEAVKHKDVLFLGQASISMLIQVHGVARHEVDDKIRQDLPIEQHMIANIRLFEEERTFGPQQTPGEPEFPVKVFRSMTSWVDKLDGDFLRSTTTPTGRTPFLHRVVAFYALSFAQVGSEARALAGKAWAQVADSFERDLRPKDRASARQLMSVMGRAADMEGAMAARLHDVLTGEFDSDDSDEDDWSMDEDE